MFDNDEGFLFKDEVTEDESNKVPTNSWKILIVDDEPDIHMVTEMALDEFTFKGRNLEILNAYSGQEARNILALHDDIALVLLDVVMETQHAGLETAKWIREDLNNDRIQIVLRTGQAGDTPEKKVIADYDINGYREKSELTAQKLFSTLCTSFRTYQSISNLQKNNQVLHQIIAAHHRLSECQSSKLLVINALDELSKLISSSSSSTALASVAAYNKDNEWTIIAGSQKYQSYIGQVTCNNTPINFDSLFADNTPANIINNDTVVVCIESNDLKKNILVIEGVALDESTDIKLIKLFSKNLALAYKALN